MQEENPIWIFDTAPINDIIFKIGFTGKGKSTLLASLLSQAALNNKTLMREAAVTPVDILRAWSVPRS